MCTIILFLVALGGEIAELTEVENSLLRIRNTISYSQSPRTQCRYLSIHSAKLPKNPKEAESTTNSGTY